MAEPVATNVFSRAQDAANGPGSGTAMSWLNTPMSSLLGISGSREEAQMKETLRWSSVGHCRRKMDFELKNASDLIASV